MNETIGIILCIVAILTGTAIMHVAYIIGVNSQKRINKLINEHDYLEGYKSGYKQGCIDTNNELDRKNMQHAVINYCKK